MITLKTLLELGIISEELYNRLYEFIIPYDDVESVFNYLLDVAEVSDSQFSEGYENGYRMATKNYLEIIKRQ